MSSTTTSDSEKGETDPLIAGKENVKALGEHGSFHDDAIDTIKLGLPIFVSMISWVGVSTTTWKLHSLLVNQSSFLLIILT